MKPPWAGGTMECNNVEAPVAHSGGLASMVVHVSPAPEV